MQNLTFTIEINAPKQKVWEIMLADETYREWTASFHEGSYYEGSWDKGSKILFLAEEDGKTSGMISHIVENKPYEYVSIEHLGEVVDGVEDTTSEGVQQWAGAHENYAFNEVDGVTTLTVVLEGNIHEDMMKMFEGMWPDALKKLKEIVER